jgi:glycosyltransferase involved in cell wall biosynthesis
VSGRTVLLDATPLRGGSGHRGIGRFIYDLLAGLESIRSEWGELRLRVVTDLGWDGSESISESPGAAAELLSKSRGSSGKSLILRRRLFLDQVAARVGADLLHLTEALGTPLGGKVPRAVTCHDLIPLRMPEQYLRLPLAPQLRRARDGKRYRDAVRVAAISDQTARDLRELLGIPEARIEVLPNGIDLAHWHPHPKPDDSARLGRLGIGSGPFVIYAGYFDARKDIPTLLAAVAEARRELPLTLVWAGLLSRGAQRELRQVLRQSGVLDFLKYVHFTGFVSADDLAVLYRKAAAHVFLSRMEGFGLSVAEAMACGCPVILTRGSGADEVGGEAAIAVAPGDARAAAAAILRVAKEPGERNRLVAAGVARAERFDRNHMARRYVEFWRRTM